MAVEQPVTGSFYEYAVKYLSPATGFVCGWMYWLNWALAAAAAFTASGIIVNLWVPSVPVWVWCVVFACVLAYLNLISAKAYGETEFWFASVKVFAIVAFIITGVLIMLGFIPTTSHIVGLSNFTADGLFPNGISAVAITMIAVVYSFQGAELVGIAVGEVEKPDKNVPRVINGVATRLVLFEFLSIAVLAATIPWKEAGVAESPFATVFSLAGLPMASAFMSFVVLTSALSANNGALYTCSRLLWSMANRGMAPQVFAKLNKNRVPYMGMVLTLIVAGLSLLTQAFAPTQVYLWLMATTGIAGTVAWIMISLSHIPFRRAYLRSGKTLAELKYRAPLFPLVPILSIILNVIVIGALYFDPNNQITLVAGLGAVLFLYVFYWIFSKRLPRKAGA